MRITSIAVSELFGMFNHSVTLKSNDHITIVYGPNGYGKTYLLKAVDDLFNMSFNTLAEAPFKYLSVGLDGGQEIIINRTGNNEQGIEAITVESDEGKQRTLSNEEFSEEFADKVHVRLIDTERLMQYSNTHNDIPVISLCAEKMQQMLSIKEVYADNLGKVQLLKDIVNSRFNHKRIVIDPESGFYFETKTGIKLRPDQLSSGEKHAVIILFELLFNIKPETLILIDEPELSLHIFWQQQFINDLEKINRFTAFDILIATHSPQIIHDRWDLAVELEGPVV